MRINPAYVVRDVFGKMILIPYKKTKMGNHPIYLNDTGRAIVELLAESETEIDLCQKVAQMYSLERGSEEFAQIEEFITNLLNMEVVICAQE